jgi:hypothetical protein
MAKQLAVVPDLEAELETLFGLPPADFTGARNDLAKRLKQAGQRAAAATVQQLRKPTVAVWAVNQLARRHAKDVDAFLTAAEQLRAAQEEALGGGDSAKLRSATSAERQALRTLTQRASDVLAGEGHSPTPAVLDRVASMLRAAAVDPQGRDLLAAGRLSEELASAGFGAFEGMKIPARSTRARAAKPKAKRQDPAAERRRQERLRKLRERSKKLAAAAAEAEREAERVRRNAERARAAADRAGAELEAAEQDKPD